MIIEEYPIENMVRHYSDSGMMIRQIETDILYEDAIDTLPCPFSYEETNILISDLNDLNNLQFNN